MNIPRLHSPLAKSTTHGRQHRGIPVEKSYRNCITAEEAERKWFESLLWKAFPEARSETQLADLVAEVLTTEKRPVHPRTVRNWLRCDNAPGFHYTLRVIALAGTECLFDLLDPEAR